MGANNWRPTVTMNDWMRDMEKRVAHEERRPSVRPAFDIVGPGIGTYSVLVPDWNSGGPVVDGFFYSIADQVVNSPDDTRNWMGIVQANPGGSGLQRVWEYIDTADDPSPDPALFTRAFITNDDGTRTYTVWQAATTGGGSGGGGTTGNPVRAATTAAIVLSGTQSVDAVSLVVGDRVLVKNQPTAADNGIYVVAAGAWTRATDADTTAEVAFGTTVAVSTGPSVGTNANGGKVFSQTENMVTIGTSAQTWRVVTHVDSGGVFLFPRPNGVGHMFYNTSQKSIAVWDGTNWIYTGQPLICTSTTRPTNVSNEFVIYESDTGLAYIWSSSAWRPFGGGGGAAQTLAYTFTQGVAATPWVINHPLTFRPNVTVTDSTGRQVEGDVVYTSAGTVTITFSGAFAGTAYLS